MKANPNTFTKGGLPSRNQLAALVHVLELLDDLSFLHSNEFIYDKEVLEDGLARAAAAAMKLREHYEAATPLGEKRGTGQRSEVSANALPFFTDSCKSPLTAPQCAFAKLSFLRFARFMFLLLQS
jgi:hypothetical protein